MGFGRTIVIALALLAAVAVGVCAWPPDPDAPPGPVSGPIPARIAPPERALTFAFLRGAAGTATLVLVAGVGSDEVLVVPLGDGLPPAPSDPFEALDLFGEAALVRMASDPDSRGRTVRMSDLAPTGSGTRHVATGTNFRDHAAEVAIAQPFLFPKFGAATPAVTLIERPRGSLLDYEVEICVRFDRALRTAADFDAARKAFFLCGDFTDRAALMRLLPDEPAPSGIGFTDAKSGPGFFPTGPFLVVPADWRAFVAEERITTRIDDRLRQDAFGRDMTLDFAALTERILSQGRALGWRYRGEAVPLFPGDALDRGTTIMSGTPAGVIFRPPGPREIACGTLAYVCLLGFLEASSLRRYVIDRYARRLEADGRFLRPGTIVHHESSRMGAIRVEVR